MRLPHQSKAALHLPLPRMSQYREAGWLQRLNRQPTLRPTKRLHLPLLTSLHLCSACAKQEGLQRQCTYVRRKGYFTCAAVLPFAIVFINYIGQLAFQYAHYGFGTHDLVIRGQARVSQHCRCMSSRDTGPTPQTVTPFSTLLTEPTHRLLLLARFLSAIPATQNRSPNLCHPYSRLCSISTGDSTLNTRCLALSTRHPTRRHTPASTYTNRRPPWTYH